MKFWSILTNALAGWQMIVRGQPGWRDRFTLSAAGMTAALSVFAFVAFLAVAFASMSIGMPSGFGVLAVMVVLALPIISLLFTLVTTRNILKSETPMLPVLVPGIYAMTAFLLIEGVLAMIGGPIVMLAWFGVGYLLFRLTRMASDWNIGVAVGFAVLTVVLLVAMRFALYMLSNVTL